MLSRYIVICCVVLMTSTAAAKHPPGHVFRDGPGLPEMVVIPPGSFVMGSTEAERFDRMETPRHPVRIARAFAVGRFSVYEDIIRHGITNQSDDAFIRRKTAHAK